MRSSVSVVKRHWFELRHTPAEVFDLLYWPLFDLLAWGLLTEFLRSGDVDLPLPVGFLIGAALLWNVLFRVQNDISVTFLGDVWSGNLITLLASPITPARYLAGAMMWTLGRLTVQWGIMTVLAWAVFHFGLFSFGIALVPFLAALMLFGVAMSLFILGVVIRVGHGANILAWGLAGIVQPLSAVYYPLDILPGWGQAIAGALPTAHLFEAMRAVLAGEAMPWGALRMALALDVVYLVIGVWFARAMFQTLRDRGFVTRYA